MNQPQSVLRKVDNGSPHPIETGVERPGQRWTMLAILLCLASISGMAQFAMAPLGPFILEDLGIGKAEFGILSSAVVFSSVFTTFGIGLIIDIIGVRRMAILGTLVLGACFTSFYFLSTVTYTIALILLVLAGIGYSAIVPLTNAGIVQWFPQAERGLAMGVKQAGIPLGAVLSTMILTQVATRSGWKDAVSFLGALILVAGLLSYVGYRDGPSSANFHVIDKPALAKLQQSIKLAFDLLKRSDIFWLCLLGISLTVTQVGLINFLVPFLREDLHIDAVAASIFLGIFQVTGMIGRPFVGMLSDRWRRGETLFISALLTALLLVLLSLIRPPVRFGWLMAFVVVMGTIVMGWVGPYYSLSVEQVQRTIVGTASSLAVTACMVGSLIGPPLFGAAVDMTSYRAAIIIFAAQTLVVGLLFRRNT